MIVCSSNQYKYKGVEFEDHKYCGPHPLDSDGDPIQPVPDSFWAIWNEFNTLENKEDYLIHKGGCRVL
jgi:hypothetical protein